MLRRETRYKPIFQKDVIPVHHPSKGGDPLDLSDILAKIPGRPTHSEQVLSVPYDFGLGGIGDMAADMSWVSRYGAPDRQVKAAQDMSRDTSWVRAGAIAAAIAAQENAPQPLNPPVRITRIGASRRLRVDKSRDYWLFRGEVYSTERGVCSSDDVKALALEGENKTKARLARAHALMAQVDALERGGRAPIPDDVKMFVWQRDGGK